MKKLIFFLFLCLPVSAFATPADQYGDSAASCGGGDGTIGNPFCSCAEWAAQGLTLTGPMTFHWTGTDTASCNFTGWTTTITNFPTILGYNLNTADYGTALTVDVPFTVLESAVLKKDAINGDITILRVTGTASSITLHDVLVINGTTLTRDGGFYSVIIGNGGGANIFRNVCIVNPVLNGMTYSISTSSTADFYNISIRGVTANNAVGLEISRDSDVGATYNVKNVVAVGTGTLTEDFNIIAPLFGTYNFSNTVSEDTTAPDAGGQSKTIIWANSTDCDIANTETDLYNQGTDLSGTGFSDDIHGTTRPVDSIWDIGAMEASSVSPTTTTTTTVTTTTAAPTTTTITSTTSTTSGPTTTTSTTTTTTMTLPGGQTGSNLLLMGVE